MLPTGRCNITLSPREKSPLRCGLSSELFDHLFSVMSMCVYVCLSVCDAGVLSLNTETDGDGFWYKGYHRGQLEEARTHKSAKTHHCAVFVPHDLDLLIPQINRFLGLTWNISMSTLVILAAAVFEISCGTTDQQTNRQTTLKTVPPRLPA